MLNSIWGCSLCHGVFLNLIQVEESVNRALIGSCLGERIETARVLLLLDQGAEVNYQDAVKDPLNCAFNGKINGVHASLVIYHRLANQHFGGQAMPEKQSA